MPNITIIKNGAAYVYTSAQITENHAVGGRRFTLQNVVTMNGAVAVDANYNGGNLTYQVTGASVQTATRIEFRVFAGYSELRVTTGNVMLEEDRNQHQLALMEQFEGIPYRTSGDIGPFHYELKANLDLETPTDSYFSVELSLFSIKIIDTRLDINNPKINLNLSVAGVGVCGELGVDFDRKKVYANFTLKYFVGEKSYHFDLYNWGNVLVSVNMTADAEQEDTELAYAVRMLQDSGTAATVTVRNNGGYIARFSVSYVMNGQNFTKNSGTFTLGVNKSIDIPTGASEISVKVEDQCFINTWSTIFSQKFSSPVSKSYEVWGTTLAPKWKEI